ncbi:poly(A) RNA polymerase GLD2 [Aplochiton taeniatus]
MRTPDRVTAESPGLHSKFILNNSPLIPQMASQESCTPDTNRALQDYVNDPLSGQVAELFEACQQQTSDLERKEFWRVRLQREIHMLYPAARLYLTGSSMNGFGCRSSDADLCLVVKEGPMNQANDAISVLVYIQYLFNKLPFLERPQLIRAKVPILKFREKSSRIEFDLNVNNTVGIRNTFLLRSYSYVELRVRPLILVVKKWARHHQINDASKGTLSSYSLGLMVLHYLQTLPVPVLPSLQKDFPGCFHPFMEIDQVPEGPRRIPPYWSPNKDSLGDLLLGFLKYYSDFSWDKQVISVREGRALPKTNQLDWRNKLICVEEPFDRTNTARAVHETVKLNAIQTRFAESCKILEKSKDLNSILPVFFTALMVNGVGVGWRGSLRAEELLLRPSY